MSTSVSPLGQIEEVKNLCFSRVIDGVKTRLLVFPEEAGARLLLDHVTATQALNGSQRDRRGDQGKPAKCDFRGQVDYTSGLVTGIEFGFYYKTPSSPGPHVFPDGQALNIEFIYEIGDSETGHHLKTIDIGRHGRIEVPSEGLVIQPGEAKELALSSFPFDFTTLAPRHLDWSGPVKVNDGIAEITFDLDSNIIQR